jgi:hypothetical protein
MSFVIDPPSPNLVVSAEKPRLTQTCAQVAKITGSGHFNPIEGSYTERDISEDSF